MPAAALMLCLTACGSVRLAPAASTNVIPWINAAPAMPTPTPPPVIPAGTRPCAMGDLRVTYEGGEGLGGGQLVATIAFVNTGITPCSLEGVPGVALLDARGNMINTNPSGYLITDRSDPVLMAAGGGSRQAYVPLAWPAIDLPNGGLPCPSAATAAAIRLALPSGGERRTLPAVQPADAPMRASITPCHGLLAVGAFQAVEPSVQPTPTPHPFTYHVVLPASVRAGSNLSYTVTFTDTTVAPVTFSEPCPNYHEDLYFGRGGGGPPLGKHIYALNCRPVKVIAPQASVTFAMVLDVPATANAGDYTLLWAPDEGIDTQDIQRLPIVVTR
jgi:Protein of unknown function (DUF4232)